MTYRMKLKQFSSFILLILTTIIAVTQVQAHQQKYAITTIELNPRTENLEIIHRFLVHDAEHVVKQLFKPTADFNKQPETQKAFADYVIESFKIKLQDQEPVLVNVGFESDEKYFWVYQEVEKPEEIQFISVKQTALQEIWPKQTNLVNVEGFGKIKSVELKKGSDWQLITLDKNDQ